MTSKNLFSSEVKLFFNLKKTFQPIINVFSSIQSKHQTCSNNSWMKFTKYSDVIGHIHFSLEYIYTLKKLNVIISHLTGVSNLGKINKLFPSQIQTIFIIVLQLRQRIDFSLNKKEFNIENDDLHRSYFTTPVQTFANPCFDQLFVFDIPFNELKHSELVFSVLYSASNDQNIVYSDTEEPYDISKTFNLLSSLCCHQSSQKSSQSGKIAGGMLCIGEAIYRIDHEKLINYPKELIHIWQEFYPPLNSSDKSIIEKKPNSLRNDGKFNREATELIFRATYCLNNIYSQSVTSQPIKITELGSYKIKKINKIENGYILDHIKIPSDEYLTLNIEINELINYSQNIQIVFEIFIQTNFSGQILCLTRIVLSSTKVNNNYDKNHESTSLQYSDLIRELHRLKENNSFSSTQKITYWHQINRT
ncbi:hypothetical protein MS3_00002770 [Schistosoma haematobium]|uniref:C2 domain-containing protein n=1 Tax=Schistosoma haematobium TaxID=6185 RepID=A0A095ASE9_SCHHA|nr:hypothetical protein MS3_00002770 [Schistosoma haematobium]KAH9589854.1 hypothetical protein MS3_00002770 [Schistosoma haematobium]